MQPLFNYITLTTRLEKTTRTLFVTLNRPDWNNAFRLEMLFELESLLAWCTSKVEINTIYIDSCTKEFSSGLELNHLENLTVSGLDKINTKLQKIIFSLMQLPQTVIIDLGHGSQTIASEFALGADIRIAHEQTQIRFDHCQFGLIPAAGGMSMLSTITSPAIARSWVLSGKSISKDKLSESGFIFEFYNNENKEETKNRILSQISKAAPFQRIQSKLGLFENLRSSFESGIISDRKIAKASMISEDWKSKKIESKEFDFMPAKSMAYSVKLSLIKSDESQSTLDH